MKRNRKMQAKKKKIKCKELPAHGWCTEQKLLATVIDMADKHVLKY